MFRLGMRGEGPSDQGLAHGVHTPSAAVREGGPSRRRPPAPPWHRRLAAGPDGRVTGPSALRAGAAGLYMWPL